MTIARKMAVLAILSGMVMVALVLLNRSETAAGDAKKHAPAKHARAKAKVSAVSPFADAESLFSVFKGTSVAAPGVDPAQVVPSKVDRLNKGFGGQTGDTLGTVRLASSSGGADVYLRAGQRSVCFAANAEGVGSGGCAPIKDLSDPSHPAVSRTLLANGRIYVSALVVNGINVVELVGSDGKTTTATVSNNVVSVIMDDEPSALSFSLPTGGTARVALGEPIATAPGR